MEKINLEDRVVKLEGLARNLRIVLIVLTGFIIYDAVKNSGVDIIYAEKIKAREYVLLNKEGQIAGSWDYRDTQGFSMISDDGHSVTLSPEALDFFQDKEKTIRRTTVGVDELQLRDTSGRARVQIGQSGSPADAQPSFVLLNEHAEPIFKAP